ncbi:hypothetical protein GCM10025783_31550 [Amnibacterium soli]|uniref:AMP-dependent synthetase/ligase domain-containing protein n=1 Tax=Amnibacterium soli TaxID=1282736 RepID=A0ABP8ZG67_9MICO
MSFPPLRRPALSVNWSTIWDRIAQADPDRAALVWRDERTSFGDLEDRAARLAGWLQHQGVQRDDRVACLLNNRPEYVVSMYAAMKLGAVPVNLNFRYAEAELRHVVEMTRPRVVVVAASLVDRLVAASAGTAEPPVLVAVEDGSAPATGVPFAEAIAGARAPGCDRSGADRIFLLTGGTTGMPRAVVYRHDVVLDTQLTSAYSTLGVDFPHDLEEAVGLAVDPALEHPVTLPITPLMHAMAFFNAMNTLLTGGTLVFLPSRRFDPAAALETVAAHGVTRLIIAGDAVAVPLAEELGRRPDARFDSLRTVMSSGMAWSDRTKRTLLERTDAELIDIVGASEGGPFAMSRTGGVDELPSRLRLLPGAVLLDGQDDELEPVPGAVGLLAYRGATPEGYFEDPVRTATVYRRVRGTRYLVPGDWARFEADGDDARARRRRREHRRGERLPRRGRGRARRAPGRRRLRGVRAARRALGAGGRRGGGAAARRDRHRGGAAGARRRAPRRLQEAAAHLHRHHRARRHRQGPVARPAGARGRGARPGYAVTRPSAARSIRCSSASACAA